MTSEVANRKPAKAKPRTQATKPAAFSDASFIQYELDTAMQAACKAWSITADSVFDTSHNLCEQGYRITLKPDLYNNCFAAFIQQTSADGPNAGYILTGRGSTPFKALKQALYKHFEVMAQDWEPFAGRERGAELDD